MVFHFDLFFAQSDPQYIKVHILIWIIILGHVIYIFYNS